jgi:hypothetical protein
VSTPHKAFDEAAERDETLRRGHDRLIPLASAIIAVLAALGTMLAHHRSIQALSAKNEAIITTAKASDRYAYYQSQRTRVVVYQAFVAAGAAKGDAERSLRTTAGREQTASLAVLADAKKLEARAVAQEQHSESLLGSFETLEIATTLFEIAIVFSSISALTETRSLLWAGIGLAAVGVALAIAGLAQAR